MPRGVKNSGLDIKGDVVITAGNGGMLNQEVQLEKTKTEVEERKWEARKAQDNLIRLCELIKKEDAQLIQKLLAKYDLTCLFYKDIGSSIKEYDDEIIRVYEFYKDRYLHDLKNEFYKEVDSVYKKTKKNKAPEVAAS